MVALFPRQTSPTYEFRMDGNVCGVRVRVTTSTGENVEGEIFTFDQNTQTVVLGVAAYAFATCCCRRHRRRRRRRHSPSGIMCIYAEHLSSC